MSQPTNYNEVKEAAEVALQKITELFKKHFPIVSGNVYEKFTVNNGWGFKVVHPQMPGFNHLLFNEHRHFLGTDRVLGRYRQTRSGTSQFNL